MKKLAILAAVQMGTILGWAGYHEHVRAHAPTFRIPLQPSDPYDVLRGRYFVLNPLDRQLKTGLPGTHLSGASVERFLGNRRAYNGTAAVGLCRIGEVHRVCDLQPLGATPGGSDPLWSRARVTVYWEDSTFRENRQVPEPGWRVSLDLGLDRFFLPDGFQLPGRERDLGWELEVSHRPGQLLLPRRLWFQGKPVGREP